MSDYGEMLSGIKKKRGGSGFRINIIFKGYDERIVQVSQVLSLKFIGKKEFD